MCDSTVFSVKDLLRRIKFMYWVQQRREILSFVSGDTQTVLKMCRVNDTALVLIKFNRFTEIMVLKIQHNLILIFSLAS